MLCESVHRLNREYHSLLSHDAITKNVFQIMKKFSDTKDEGSGLILFNILIMISRLKLLDEIEFDLTQLYILTDSIQKNHICINNMVVFQRYFSKVWIAIFNASKNTLEINTIDKLMLFAAIFANHLSQKINTTVLKNLKLNISQKIQARAHDNLFCYGRLQYY
ncbi:hypothetical protein RF11_13758 [Thelohanellus kitauei]|uniref:Uncharacterized protein n=1 Tax=Thelohanellus kitauei TaxID=669202 RepID=A0A0C2NHI6_THEKT|nr:hypothetical protein RF11_13758 [Thelohanellus kitauei]